MIVTTTVKRFVPGMSCCTDFDEVIADSVHDRANVFCNSVYDAPEPDGVVITDLFVVTGSEAIGPMHKWNLRVDSRLQKHVIGIVEVVKQNRMRTFPMIFHLCWDFHVTTL